MDEASEVLRMIFGKGETTRVSLRFDSSSDKGEVESRGER